MLEKLRILFIEDNENDTILAISLLKKEGYDIYHQRVDNAVDLRKALGGHEWDIVISDFAMPGFSGSEALEIFNVFGLDIPFILVSGSVGEEIAISMLKSGANDYIMKDKLNLIVPSVNRELKEYANRKERREYYNELKRAQKIVLQSPITLWQWSSDSNAPVVYVSENVMQFGYSSTDFTSGKIFFKDIVHPDDIKKTMPYRNKNISDDLDSYSLEYRIICKDGSTRWVSDQTTIIRKPTGEIDYIQGLIIDISKQKNSEDRVIASEKRFKELMENMEMIALILDNDGKIQFCNDYLLQLTGWELQQVINQDWFEMFVPPELNLKDNVFSLAKIDKLTTYGENEIITKTGERRTIAWSNTLLKDASSQTIGVASIGQDITDRLQFEKKLQESEELYKSLVETSPDSICKLDLDGTIIYCNQRKADMFGYNQPEDLIGMNTFGLIASEYQYLIQDMTNQLLTNGNILPLELKFVKKSEEEFWGEIRSTLIRDKKGNPKNAINVLSDITERKKMQEAWHESEVRFRAAFDNAPIGMELIDLTGKIMRANKAFCDLTGYNYEELNNINFRDFTHPEDLIDNENHVQKLITGNQDNVSFEKRYIRKDGKHIWVNVSASLFRSAQGDPQYFIAQVEDITHRKHVAEEIMQAKNKAEESDKLKSALLTNMSHELRTPMNGILGFTELILQSSVLNEVKVMARMIDVSGKRLLQTLDSIMLLAQLQVDSQKIQVNLTPTDISEVVLAVAQSMADSANDKGLEYKIDINPAIHVEVEPKLLRNAISTVVENAVKYTSQGTIKISVHTDVVDGKEMAFIMVQDTGIGIPEQYKETIFEEFRQVSEGYDRNYEGIGIGLSITKKLIELFKGYILVKSAPGIGSTFSIVLPLYKEVTKLKEEHQVKKVPAKKAKAAKSNTDSRILIVEDNMVNTKLLVHFLSDYCGMIDCVSTGEAAVDMTKTNVYDAILMDINLGSGIDGLQATQQIRKHEGYDNIPIIAVTGYTMIGDKERLLDGGCSHYIGKPFNQETVLTIMNEIFA